MSKENESKLAYLISFAVIAIGVTGYFVGMSSPMNPQSIDGVGGATGKVANDPGESGGRGHAVGHSKEAVGAADASFYGQMRRTDRSDSLPVSFEKTEPIGTPEIKIQPEQKEFALAMREQRRAFNGAPPTVPHPIDQTSAKSCLACHGAGARSQSLRIPQMSHKFYVNCTQCHVESSPSFAKPIEFRKNSFVGLAAPKAGPRAYSKAPPQIPHTTWMRSNCLSCHGNAGSHGMKTTHPWRTNCTQCHAPSSDLEQQLTREKETFLPKIKIEKGGVK